jgi:hypothetical protein
MSTFRSTKIANKLNYHYVQHKAVLVALDKNEEIVCIVHNTLAISMITL